MKRILLAVALVAGAALLWVGARAAQATGGSWTAARRGELVLGVPMTGSLQAVDTSVLGPPQVAELWEFKIVRLAPEGSTVKKGQPVLAFDTSELDRRLQEKSAENDQAGKEIEKKEADLAIKRRDDDLRLAEALGRQRKAELKLDVPAEVAQAKELAKSRIDLELATREVAAIRDRVAAAGRAAEAELKALRDRRDRAAARVKEIQEGIQLMTQKAPRDGTVIYVEDRRRGEKKKVGDACWRMEKVLEIPGIDQMRAEGEIDEADAGKVAVGQRVTFRLDAHPDIEFVGRVINLRNSVERRSKESPAKVVRLDLELDRTDPARMRPGMRLRGTIVTARKNDTLLVPVDAVFPTSDGPVAYRRGMLGSQTRPLKVGRRNRESVEVLDGLEAGDVVSRLDLGGRS